MKTVRISKLDAEEYILITVIRNYAKVSGMSRKKDTQRYDQRIEDMIDVRMGKEAYNIQIY